MYIQMQIKLTGIVCLEVFLYNQFLAATTHIMLIKAKGVH